jgi:hypothetical protein
MTDGNPNPAQGNAPAVVHPNPVPIPVLAPAPAAQNPAAGNAAPAAPAPAAPANPVVGYAGAAQPAQQHPIFSDEWLDDRLSDVQPEARGCALLGTIGLGLGTLALVAYTMFAHGCHAITGDSSYIRRNNDLVPRYTQHNSKPLRTTDGNALVYHLSDGTQERYSFEENVDDAHKKLTREVNKYLTPSSTMEQRVQKELEVLRQNDCNPRDKVISKHELK